MTNLDRPLLVCKFEAIRNTRNLTDDSLATGAFYDPNQEKFWEIGRELDHSSNEICVEPTRILTSSLNEHADPENLKFEA